MKGRWQHINLALDVVTTVALAVAAVFAAWSFVASASARAEDVTEVEDLSSVSPMDPQHFRHVAGQGRAVVVEFSDYECPFCRQYSKEVYPRVARELVATGAARYAFMNYPLEGIHPLARPAAEAAECAGHEGKFWEMHDRLFAAPDAIEPAALAFHASELRLPPERFEACLSGDVTKTVRSDTAQGRRLGVASTPTFFVGVVQPDGRFLLTKRIAGVPTFEALADAVAAVSQPAWSWARIRQRQPFRALSAALAD